MERNLNKEDMNWVTFIDVFKLIKMILKNNKNKRKKLKNYF